MIGAAGIRPCADAQAAPQHQEAGQLAPSPVTQESLHAAEELIGVPLTSAQEAAALTSVGRNLTGYKVLRQLDIPLNIEPAVIFRPLERRGVLPSTQKRFVPGKVDPAPFKSVADLAFCSTLQLADLLRTRKVSSLDLTKMYLERLKRYGPKLYCVVTLTEELALQQAAQADDEIRRGKYRGPLHGIPWGAKDLFATKGIPTTWGAEPFRSQVFDYDATIVERLRDAGAVLLAKLSMGELAQGAQWFKGVTRNPWDPEETNTGSGGSSAGPACATSAGLVAFAVGTETHGSILSPSSRCGVVGLRPTYGRVSRHGAMALSWSLDKVGPLCRSVEDCAAVLYHMYGPDGRDLSVSDADFVWNAGTPDVRKMRIGYIKTEFDQAEESKKGNYQSALETLKAAGMELHPVALPGEAYINTLQLIRQVESAAQFDDITRNGQIDTLTKKSPKPNNFRVARFIPAVEYVRALRARTLLMREMDQFMSQWDVFVSPAPESAGLLITNLTGHPAVSVPCGFVKGQPQAIMFTGRLYEEAALLNVALAFERGTNWRTMHPQLKD
jgi:Asp-tRNA(Asn)/Glu-tRNA(Gln) amidotransferase A subunit family amidase